MGNISENVLDAAEILIDQSINKASYNKTIQAQIISCEDATIGKYKCRYQDAIIYAYSENPDVTYNEKTFVYIDIPGNNMNKDKFIRGTSKRLGINYISQAEGDQAYDIIGTNCLTTNTTFYLDSKYKSYRYVIYKHNDEQENSQQIEDNENEEQELIIPSLQLDIKALEQYIKQSSSLIAGATFRTSLPAEQQNRGHYGITYKLCFFDNALNKEVIRSYTVDEDNMIDNPYRLIYPTRQYQIFDIDGPNFKYVDSIEIFNEDFPNANEEAVEGPLQSGNIEITNLELIGAVRMADSEINGIAISFYTPQGTFFTGIDGELTEKAITAQVRVKGKLASSAQDIPFYWGIENVGITPDSEYYNKYLGRGWRCLNDKNVIQTKMEPIEATDIFFINQYKQGNYYYYKDISNKAYVKGSNDETYTLMNSSHFNSFSDLEFYYQKNNVVEWIPGEDTYLFKRENATARNNKIKVAIVYDGTVITKTITIQNLMEAIPVLTIESSDGTEFYYDIGHPTLTCKINGEQDFSCRYQWSYEDRHGFGQVSAGIISCQDETYFSSKEQETNLKQYEEDIKNIANTLYSDQTNIKKELNDKIGELQALVNYQNTITTKDNAIIEELNGKIQEIDDSIQLVEPNTKENYQNNLKKLYGVSFQISSDVSEEFKEEFQKLMDEFQNQKFEDDKDQKNYVKALADIAQLQIEIINGSKYLNSSQESVQEKINVVDDFKYYQRASGNKVYDVQIRNISSFKTFKCSVYNRDGFYLGTASITLTNKLQTEDLYSLVINNGSTTFQYNEDGVAPTSKSLQNPQQIQALSFTVYDNLGNPIDSEVIQNTKNCEITWRIPLEDTMLIDLNEDGPDKIIIPNKCVEYSRLNLLYGIANGYNIQKQNNQIELTVKYNEMNLTTRTNFTFVKQGEPGTNGTQYVVKIVPNTKMNNPPLYPMITKIGNDGTSYRINYGIGTEGLEDTIDTGAVYQLFKAQLWHGGQKVWEGFSANDDNNSISLDGITKPTLVNWEVLQNSGNKDTQQKTSFEIEETDSGDGKIRYKGNNYHTTSNDDKNGLYKVSTALANIIKCSIKWEDKLYYGTIPITTAWVTDDSYRIKLKDNTGFRYVIYTSDGVNPQYDKTNPFEFICMKKNEIDKDTYYWEDISLLEGINYTSGNDVGPRPAGTSSSFLTVLGRTEDKDENGNKKENLIPDENSYYRKNCEKNQWIIQPVSRYDGDCVNAAIWCAYSTKDKDNNTTIIGRIHIPIHLLLNKYGMAHINEWDGNSVQINNEGGYILSPQMGAGTKNDKDNTFTGILMGEVKEAGKDNKEIGLFGYASGARTFFLDSQTGAAILGKNTNNETQGRIIIDPSSKKALLFSSNYWGANNYDEKGLPKNYSAKSSGNGMLIDLSTPQIKFGSGKFKVSSEGELYAAGGGKIAGWDIGTDKLTGGLLTLNSNGSIYAQSKENGHNAIDAIGKGFFLSGAGLSIGSRFKVTNNGVAYIGQNATENGGKKDKKGNPVTPNKYWTISGDDTRSYISYGGDVKYTAATEGQTDTAVSKVYLGTDGISLGKRFSVNSDGDLIAYSGTIGGWKINKDSLQSPKTAKYTNSKGVTTDRSLLTIKNDGSIYGGNQKYQVTDSNGKKTGQIRNYCWSIDANGTATFNYLNANKYGKIGGWTINSNSLTGGKMTINSEGSISGPGWLIKKSGEAYFSKIYGSVASGELFKASGFTLAAPGSGGSSLSPGGVSMAGGAGLNTNGSLGQGLYSAYKTEFDKIYVKEINIDDAYIRNKLVYNNQHAVWKKMVKSVRLSLSGNTLTLYVSNRYSLCTSWEGAEFSASSFSLPKNNSGGGGNTTPSTTGPQP